MTKEDTNDKDAQPAPQSLDDVHDATIDKLENEGDDDAQDDDSDAAGDGGDTTDQDDDSTGGADDDDSGGDDTGDDDSGDDDTDGEPPAGDDKGGSQDEEEETPPPQPAPQLDTDTSKPGDNKVSVRDYEGKTHHFNNWEEVPDDFEPASYKEWGVFTDRMNQKLADDRESQRQAERAEAEAENAKQVKELQQSWDGEITSLTNAKVLPTDEKEREAVIDGVYNYMASQLSKGVVIDSWAEAYKGYSWEQMQKENQDKQQQLNDNKKRRGSMVQGAGTPQPSSKPKIYEALPPGITLDQAHERALESL